MRVAFSWSTGAAVALWRRCDELKERRRGDSLAALGTRRLSIVELTGWLLWWTRCAEGRRAASGPKRLDSAVSRLLSVDRGTPGCHFARTPQDARK